MGGNKVKIGLLSILILVSVGTLSPVSSFSTALPIVLKDMRDGIIQGQMCWNYSNTNLQISGTVKLRFISAGGTGYLCSGTVFVPSINSTFSAFGNAETVEDKIVITLSLAGIRNGTMGIDMIKAILDPTSLAGNFQQFGVYQGATELTGGTLTNTTCQ